jgi:hypothetical protein
MSAEMTSRDVWRLSEPQESSMSVSPNRQMLFNQTGTTVIWSAGKNGLQ